MVAVEPEAGGDGGALRRGQQGQRPWGEGVEGDQVVVGVGPQVDGLRRRSVDDIVGVGPTTFVDEVERIAHGSLVALRAREVNRGARGTWRTVEPNGPAQPLSRSAQPVRSAGPLSGEA